MACARVGDGGRPTRADASLGAASGRSSDPGWRRGRRLGRADFPSSCRGRRQGRADCCHRPGTSSCDTGASTNSRPAKPMARHTNRRWPRRTGASNGRGPDRATSGPAMRRGRRPGRAGFPNSFQARPLGQAGCRPGHADAAKRRGRRQVRADYANSCPGRRRGRAGCRGGGGQDARPPRRRARTA